MAKSLYRSENLLLAALLRDLRGEQGLIQTALAEKLGKGQTYVSNVELGIRRLDLVELRDYCAGLGIGLQAVVERWEKQLKPVTGSSRRQQRRKSV